MNKNSILTIIIMFILCLVYLLFENDFKNIIKILLEKEFLLYMYSIAILIAFVVHDIHKIKTSSHLKIVHSDIFLFDTILNIATFITISSTALALLKGIYLQYFFKIEYFVSFKDFDLWTIFGVSAFLLWYVTVRIIGLFKEAVIFKPQEIEK